MGERHAREGKLGASLGRLALETWGQTLGTADHKSQPRSTRLQLGKEKVGKGWGIHLLPGFIEAHLEKQKQGWQQDNEQRRAWPLATGALSYPP